MFEDPLPFIISEATAWVRAQRDAFRPQANPLSETDAAALSKYFAPEVVSSARFAQASRVSNPPFYESLRSRGFTQLLDFAQMVGITFNDTVVLATPMLAQLTDGGRQNLLFHELVHVAQYRRLGVDRFIHHYVTSWAEQGFRYERIIFEIHAYSLDREFSNSPAPFSVEQRLAILMHGLY